MMKDMNSYQKPGFEPDEAYWKQLENRLLDIPSEVAPDPKVRPMRRARWWAAAAVIALLLTAVPFIPRDTEVSLTAEDIELYLEGEGAWMIEDLAFYEEVQDVDFVTDAQEESNDYDLLYLEDADEFMDFMEMDI
ncbi:hypothetical protein HZ996_09745 [Cryomorphaceae bacterium]|nr:hypothetical protein HZ996_09745 [Cryomorphaceae bacterium]